MFFDRQAESAGEEVTVLIQKGTVEAIDDGGNPVVSDTQNMFCFWIQPYWNGSSWTTNWQWLNKTIITKVVTASNATYPNMIEIHGGTNQGIAEDSLIGWVIYNKTKNEYAKIITIKAVDSDTSRVNHTLYNSSWDVDDVLIISRFWLDTKYHTEFYDNVEWTDIQFHRLLNDIRIGSGGYENRAGIAIGYRNKYLNIEEIDFTNLHSDLTAAAIEAFAEIDQVVLDTHILELDNAYGLYLTEVAGSLPADTYYFRLIGVMDGYSKQLLYEEEITLSGSNDLTITPWLSLARMNPRLTERKRS